MHGFLVSVGSWMHSELMTRAMGLIFTVWLIAAVSASLWIWYVVLHDKWVKYRNSRASLDRN